VTDPACGLPGTQGEISLSLEEGSTVYYCETEEAAR